MPAMTWRQQERKYDEFDLFGCGLDLNQATVLHRVPSYLENVTHVPFLAQIVGIQLYGELYGTLKNST
jgi:hypothetical protein